MAAESTRSGGGFSENRDSNPLSVEGGKSTLNNTDTSGATTLAAAPDAQARDAEAAFAEGSSYPEQVGGQGSFGGTHSDRGYAGGPSGSNPTGGSSGSKQGGKGGTDEQPFGTSDTDTNNHGVSGASAAKAMGKPSDNSSGGQTSSTGGNNSSSSGGDNSSSYASAAGGSSNNPSSSGNNNSSSDSRGNVDVDAAPGYISSVYSEPTKSGKPHGKNITEGGFDADDSNNASFNSEIGSKNDPGRKAEGDFQKLTQSVSGATGPRQGTGGQEGGNYAALDTDQSL